MSYKDGFHWKSLRPSIQWLRHTSPLLLKALKSFMEGHEVTKLSGYELLGTLQFTSNDFYGYQT